MPSPLPLIAIVGRPNVGKSTLFNRLIGQRRSIVTDEPGITRDRIYGTVSWNGRSYEIVDTGGIVPGEETEIPVRIFEQAQIAIDSAALIFLVVDGRTSITAPDQELARLLRRTVKPIFLVVNKIDSEKQAADISEFYRLGIDHVFPVSSEHGRGITELLDEVAISIPAPEEQEEDAVTRNPGGHYRPSECRQVHAAEQTCRAGARDGFAHRRNHPRCRRQRRPA